MEVAEQIQEADACQADERTGVCHDWKVGQRAASTSSSSSSGG